VAVNAVGTVIDPRTGKPVAGGPAPPDARAWKIRLRSCVAARCRPGPRA
jgi:hypothetical protein